MQTLHKFPKLNQQQHAEQFELQPNSNQTHQLTMPPTTHTRRHTPTAQNDGECFVSVRLQPHFAQILTHVRRPERGGAAKPNQRLWPLDDLQVSSRHLPPPFPPACPFSCRAQNKSEIENEIEQQLQLHRLTGHGQEERGRSNKGLQAILPSTTLPRTPLQSRVSISGVGFRN